MDQGKEAGGHWDCYRVDNFYGWEAERVVAVTNGNDILEFITRAKTYLAVILLDTVDNSRYTNTKKRFQQAKDQGLVEFVQLNGGT